MEQTPAFALKLDKIEAAQANVEAAVQRVAALGSDALRSALTNERHTPSTQLVEAVLACMQLLIDKTPDLAAAKKLVRRRRFVRQLRGLEISHVPRAATLKLTKYAMAPAVHVQQEGLPAELREDLEVAAALQAWVLAVLAHAGAVAEAARYATEQNVTAMPAKLDWLCRRLWQAAMDGRPHELSRLLERGGVSVDWRDDRGWTPLFAAVWARQLGCVQKLIGARASVDLPTHHGETPLIQAALDGNEPAVRLLLGANASLLVADAEGRSAVDAAREQDHAPVLALLSKYSENTYSRQRVRYGRTPEGPCAFEAASSRRAAPEKHWRAAACAQLWDAAFAGDEAEVARLIEKGVDDLDWRRADARYYRGWTPLFAAVSAGSADCTRFLLGALADVDCVTAAGSTPLIEAAARGHVEIVTLLLQAGAETQAEAADRRLGSARALALANGHKECADLIDDCESERAAAADAAKQEQGPEKAAALAATEIVERDGLQTAALERRSRQLWEAASQGDDVTLHTLLGEGADPNFRQRQSYYRAPLAAASLRGHSTCVQALIDAKALIDSPSDAGLTALMEAAVQGKDRVVECLIRNGALTSLVDRTGRSAEDHAKQKGCTASLELLYDAARIRNDELGRRARAADEAAASGKDHHGADELLSMTTARRPRRRGSTARRVYGPPAPHHSRTTERGRNAVHERRDLIASPSSVAYVHALERSSRGSELRLTQHVTAPEQVDEMRAAVLHGARDGDHGTAWSSALLGRGADVNYQDERGRTPLHWAVERGDEEHFDALLDADATLDLADDRGRTPLHGCCEIVGDVHNQFIRRLLDAAGELGTLKLVNAADDAGATGLMLATVAQNVPAMRLLLDARADAARVERVGGRTALDVALDREGDTSKSKVVELLRSAAAMQAKEDAAAHQEFLSLLKDERALLGEAGVFDGPLQRERDSQRDLLEAAETARLTTHNSRPSIETDAQIFTLVARAAAEIGVKDAEWRSGGAGAVALAAAAASAGASSHRYLPGLPRSSSRERNSSLTVKPTDTKPALAERTVKFAVPSPPADRSPSWFRSSDGRAKVGRTNRFYDGELSQKRHSFMEKMRGKRAPSKVNIGAYEVRCDPTRGLTTEPSTPATPLGTVGAGGIARRPHLGSPNASWAEVSGTDLAGGSPFSPREDSIYHGQISLRGLRDALYRRASRFGSLRGKARRQKSGRLELHRPISTSAAAALRAEKYQLQRVEQERSAFEHEVYRKRDSRSSFEGAGWSELASARALADDEVSSFTAHTLAHSGQLASLRSSRVSDASLASTSLTLSDATEYLPESLGQARPPDQARLKAADAAQKERIGVNGKRLYDACLEGDLVTVEQLVGLVVARINQALRQPTRNAAAVEKVLTAYLGQTRYPGVSAIPGPDVSDTAIRRFLRADRDALKKLGAVHDGEKWCARSHDMIVALAEGAELSVADCWRPDVDVPTADVIAYLRALAVLNYHAPLTAHTPLWAASFNGLVDAVVLLLESRANVDEPATSGTTPLMEAARGGHVDAIRMLLAYGADPCRLNRFGVSALEAAHEASVGRETCIAVLRAAQQLGGPLAVATRSGLASDRAERDAERAAADADEERFGGMFGGGFGGGSGDAFGLGRASIVERSSIAPPSRGANRFSVRVAKPGVRNALAMRRASGVAPRSAGRWARSESSDELSSRTSAAQLLNLEAALADDERRLFEAARDGNIAQLREVLQNNADVDLWGPRAQHGPTASTALGAACFHGHLGCVAALLRAGAPVDQADDGGFTPLMRAVRVGATRCVALLLRAAADVTLVNGEGRTAEDVAEQYGRTAFVAVLRDARVAGADAALARHPMDEGAAAEAAAAAESQAIKDDNGRRCAAACAIVVAAREAEIEEVIEETMQWAIDVAIKRRNVWENELAEEMKGDKWPTPLQVFAVSKGVGGYNRWRET